MASGKQLKFSAKAAREYLEALEYIAQENPQNAALVQQRIEHSVALLLENPGMGTPATARTRKHPVPGTPYTLYYRETSDALIIGHVTHQSRKH